MASASSAPILRQVERSGGIMGFTMKRGLNKEEAADYVGISSSKFDQLVSAKRMPQPRLADKRTIWDVRELDVYFDRLPVKGEATTGWS